MAVNPREMVQKLDQTIHLSENYKRNFQKQIEAPIKRDITYSQKKPLSSYAKGVLSGNINVGDAMVREMNPDAEAKRINANIMAGATIALAIPSTLQITRRANHSRQYEKMRQRSAEASGLIRGDRVEKLSTDDFERFSAMTGTHFSLSSKSIAGEAKRLQYNVRNLLSENGINVSRLNTEELEALIQRYAKSGKNEDIVTLLKMELKIRNTASDIRGDYKGNVKAKIAAKRLINTNLMQMEGMDGFRKLNSDAKNVQMLLSLTGKYYVNIARETVHVSAKTVNKVSGFALRHMNDGRARRVVGAINRSSEAVSDITERGAVKKIIDRRKEARLERVSNQKARLKNLIRRRPNIPEIGNFRFLGTIGRTLNRFKNFLTGTFDFIGMAKRAVLSAIMAVITSIGGIILAGGAFCVIILAIVLMLTTVLDAANRKIKDSTFGVTYEALSKLDQDFSQQVLDISKTAKLPDKPEYAEKNITQYTTQSVYYLNGDGENAYSSQTIKGILSMATIYIDQDFNTYGLSLVPAMLESGTCTFKQYALDLYKSSHMVGVFPTDIYYCTDDAGEEKVADPDCNNKISGGGSIEDWLTSGTGANRRYTVSLTKNIAEWEETHSRKDDEPDEVEHRTMDVYEINETGPHGSVSYSYSRNGGDASAAKREAERRMEELGCKSYRSIITDAGEGWRDYAVVCTDAECKGHVDSNVVIFVSNVYDPSLTSSTDGYDPYSTADNKSREFKYSLYALDKYATIQNSAFTDGAMTPAEVDALPDVYEAQSEMLKNIVADAGTDIKSGDVSELKAIDWTLRNLQDGVHPIDAAQNFLGNLQQGLDTVTAAYRQLNERGSLKIDEYDTGNENPVTDANSTKYKFQNYTIGSYKLNENFTGWNRNNIELVRLLMAGDWNELYGINDFGGVTGAPMSENQISQMIANNPNWSELSPDRQAVMATAVAFYNQIKRLGVNYHGGSCTANSIEELSGVASKGGAFTIGDIGQSICISKWWNSKHCKTDPGIDCSGYVSWIYYASLGFPAKKISTSGLFGYVGSALTEINPAGGDKLLPGDIALKKGHVLMFIGGGQWTEAQGHNEGINWGTTHPDSWFTKNGYRFFKLSRINDNVA